jgi:hypothetical protein
MTPKLIWRGNAAGAQWELHVTRIYEGPLAMPDFEGPLEYIPGSHVVTWTLTFASDAGEQIDGYWDPETRGLGCQLRGWSKSSIGILKRHLIKLGTYP